MPSWVRDVVVSTSPGAKRLPVIVREAIGVEVEAERSSSPALTASQPADAHAFETADTAIRPPANSANAARLIAATRPTLAIPHLSPKLCRQPGDRNPFADLWQIGGEPSSHCAQSALNEAGKAESFQISGCRVTTGQEGNF